MKPEPPFSLLFLSFLQLWFVLLLVLLRRGRKYKIESNIKMIIVNYYFRDRPTHDTTQRLCVHISISRADSSPRRFFAAEVSKIIEENTNI
jgi:hypothetical protein